MNRQEKPEISKFRKKKTKAKHGLTKVFRDAANSCRIEMDEEGNILTVMLSDDLANTFIMFGKETYHDLEPIDLREARIIPLLSNRRPFIKKIFSDTRWTAMQTMCHPAGTVGLMYDRYKRVKLKKTRLKHKQVEDERLFVPGKVQLVLEERTNQLSSVDVSFPQREKHKAGLLNLADHTTVIIEERSEDIPISKAVEERRKRMRLIFDYYQRHRKYLYLKPLLKKDTDDGSVQWEVDSQSSEYSSDEEDRAVVHEIALETFNHNEDEGETKARWIYQPGSLAQQDYETLTGVLNSCPKLDRRLHLYKQ